MVVMDTVKAINISQYLPVSMYVSTPVLMFFARNTHMRLSVCWSNEPCLQIHIATRTDHDKR